MGLARGYWLLKSEPATYSIDDLQRDGKTGWEGVRNFSARLHLRAMRRGDRAFFYHSSTTPLAVVGECLIIRAAYPDPTGPSWTAVGVRFVRKFSRPVTRDGMKAVRGLAGMKLFGHTRLSVSPVSPAEWRIILRLAGD